MSDQYSKARDYGFRLLKIRLRSKQEIEQRLKQKNFPDDVVKNVITFLTDYGYIDDTAFAIAWIKNRLKINPRSRSFLNYELKRLGIDRRIIEKTLSTLDETTEYELAKKIAKERIKKIKNESLIKIKQKLFAYLHRRGFNTETNMRIINELISHEW